MIIIISNLLEIMFNNIVILYRMTGWESTQTCLVHLYEDFQKVHEASKKDDEVDDDGDGVPDVQQVSPTDLLTRKTLIFLKVRTILKMSAFRYDKHILLNIDYVIDSSASSPLYVTILF